VSRAEVFQSNGEPVLRVYAVFLVKPARPGPPIDVARVEILDPRHATTLRDDRVRGTGPRDPAQKGWRAPKRPGIEMPDGRPIMKTQRFYIDEELLAQWDEEARTAASEAR
jgi:hypothetical protein